MSVMTLRTVILLGMLLLAVGLSAQITMIRALTLYDSGDPTPEEQLVLEYINRARANPTAEGTRLGINMLESLCDLNDVGVRPPLAMNKILLQVADYHSWDMYTNNYFAHNDLSGHDPSQRMTNAGYSGLTWGENIAVGSSGYSATNLEDDLMVDSSTSCRLHRVNLFDNNFKEVGVGYYAGATPNPSRWRNFLTQDLGSTSAGPFLVGVVYNDADGDNFYDIGEGISGVQITPNGGSYYAVSSTSGGYAFPIGTSGTITVTASGSGFGSITKTVSFTGANIKLDFTNISNNTTTKTTTTTTRTSTTSTTSTTITTIAITISTSTPPSTTTSTTSSTVSTTSRVNTTSSTTTTSTTEIPEYQFGQVVLLIAVVGLYAVMRRKPQPA
jgi:uncharacterized protein YkwD